MPDQAANQLAAEMVTHGEDVDSSVEKYERYYENFRERGYNEHAAQAMAVEALEGGEATGNFANIGAAAAGIGTGS